MRGTFKVGHRVVVVVVRLLLLRLGRLGRVAGAAHRYCVEDQSYSPRVVRVVLRQLVCAGASEEGSGGIPASVGVVLGVEIFVGAAIAEVVLRTT